ncbi:pyruvate, phosphate dikinase [Ammoniphilus sp. CFH 90114]|uniref:pyruvate, phosphate dikinase n=1 Tax=Ammoniphilus sp. CFH 90114 TaxID=2493665 RepID=UPI00100FDF04|nr:pyruvate, phosphate dikinase [Ammoniphilus sp. CFH 90114]RXT15224.1 pyruvate, phosphate dikinase [Ammoniphilus sp. CFH 90114]
MNDKHVYLFSEGNASMSDLLGRKGANLAEMYGLGLPVPFGFTVTTEACRMYYKDGKKINSLIEKQMDEALIKIEEITGKEFGHAKDPLLVSVRSGSPISMPGMMDTILNLGLNDTTVEGLAQKTGNPRFAFDSYRRFIQMFSDIVLQIDHYQFEIELEQLKAKAKVKRDADLSAAHLYELVRIYKKIIKKEIKDEFPQDPKIQLMLAIGAVFESWNNQRAVLYRRINRIEKDYGTAVNIQSMVFGNMGDDSGTGVAFTRNPNHGENEIFGEFLLNAQGEDVVAGIRTPEPLSELKRYIPEAYHQFKMLARNLETHYRAVQDIEFTIEQGKLFLLQTRNAKVTPQASIKIAVDMAQEEFITQEEALLRIEPHSLIPLLHETLDMDVEVEVLAHGLPASPGAAAGIIVFDSEEAERLQRTGHEVILVRRETSPDDIHGMVASVGILTSHGGMTSHAAVVARDMSKPCIVGCESMQLNESRQEVTFGQITLKAGDTITLDGSTGRVILGRAPLVAPTLSQELTTLLYWAKRKKTMGVLGSVNTPKEAIQAKSLGAEGIGLCRTEFMFMDPVRVPTVQEMILSQNKWERKKALDKLLPMQKSDFLEMFRIMEGKDVIIRLLDPPLHEFLPSAETLSIEIERAKLHKNFEEVQEKEMLLRRVKALHELNPSFGHRGCRIGITYPEIYEMQVTAIAEAALELKQEGIRVQPLIIVPLVSHANEMKIVREQVEETLNHIFGVYKERINIPVGCFMELPRACITAGQIVKYADFIIFGCNDLTQTTYGFSRDDAEGKYLAYYVDHKILPENPFLVLDQEGVGGLIRFGTENGRRNNPNLRVGVCGVPSSEKKSVRFFHQLGLDYLSCVPHLVPVGIVSAAQAAIRQEQAKA